MALFLLDSDHFTHYTLGHVGLRTRIGGEPAGSVALSVVSIEETLRGRLNAIGRLTRGGPRLIAAYRLMRTDVEAFAAFSFVDYDQAADTQFQQLTHLVTQSGAHDLRIAAIALANNLTVLTCNVRDFAVVPGLKVADWTV